MPPGSLYAVGRWLAAVWSLTKPGISIFIGLTASTGGILAPTSSASSPAWLFVAGFLCSGGAAAFNQFHERALDARMPRTAGRALPSGVLAPIIALVVSGLLLAAGVVAAWVAIGVAPAVLLLAGAIVYVLLYTILSKPRTVWNVPIGGLCGALAALAGAMAGGGLSVEGLAFAGLLYAWSAPHFWALAIPRAEEYAAVGIPMLPCRVGALKTAYAILGHAVFLPVPALFLWQRFPVAAVAVAVTGAIFVGLGLNLVLRARQARKSEATCQAAYRVFFFSLAHLPMVYLGFWVHAIF